jgi:hypothetical protein
MMKPDQVSEAVAKAAWTAFYNATGPTVADDWRAAIAAALNAWPGMHIHEWQRPWLGGMSGTDLIIPLTEASDE